MLPEAVIVLLPFHQESLPRLDNYRISMRNLKRPSIGELQGEAVDQVSSEAPNRGVHDVSASECPAVCIISGKRGLYSGFT
ncbi:GM20564 [Drosophila sechellia]|uniref:GM20564 n=1 Tax=Drosophila sechellia TaxID=7238 RepID=B4IPS3_DROSE|nr:GM20564 [Drosophila sechellia]